MRVYGFSPPLYIEMSCLRVGSMHEQKQGLQLLWHAWLFYQALTSLTTSELETMLVVSLLP